MWGKGWTSLKNLNFQERAALLCVIILLMPNILLAFTEDYSAAAIAASLLLPGACYLLWTQILRRPGALILGALPLMILGAFQIVLLYLFGGSIIAVDMFTNLFTTNASEAGELLGSLWPSIVFVCLLYIPLLVVGVISLRRRTHYRPSFRRRCVYTALGMLLVGTLFSWIAAQRPDYGIRYQVFPANVIYNIKLTIDKWHRSLDYPNTSRDFTFHAHKEQKAPQREIYVLVIGEASRAENWSLFGYDRQTTPRLEKREGLIPFRNVLTQCNATHKSVPIILSPVSAENFNDIYEEKSLITAFKEAGFHTLFISNQVPNRSLIDYFSEEAEHRIDISPREGALITDNRPDGEMLPYIRDKVADTTLGNLLIVLHTYGSHYNYYYRYPREFAPYQPDLVSSINRRDRDKVINAYDNSVFYTDYVLDEIISVLEQSNDCTALFYISDHGEDLMDDRRHRFLHASPTPTYYQLHIACFGWFSPTYRQTFPDKYTAAQDNKNQPATTAAAFHTITDIASLESPYIMPSRSLVSDRYQQGPHMYLNDHDKAVDVLTESGLKEEDIKMFQQRKLITD